MKKAAAVRTALLTAFAAAAPAEESTFTFRNGVTFNMDMTAAYITVR